MSASSERAAQLRELADHHEAIGLLEEEVDAAVEAYRADTSDPELKAAYRASQDALAAARQEARGSGLLVASNEPGSVTIQPAPISGKAG